MPLAWPGRLTVLLLAVAPCLLVLIAGADRVGGEHHRSHRRHVVYTHLQILNPWLSACDVVHPASAPDLQGPCSTATSGTSPHALRNTRGGKVASSASASAAAAVALVAGSKSQAGLAPAPPPAAPVPAPAPAKPPGCPKPCLNSSRNQCLHYLQESNRDSVCKAPSKATLGDLRLRYCCEHTVLSALHPDALKSVLNGQNCHMYIKAVLEVDALAARLSCEFGELLTRFDCDHPYSMHFGCADCQEAYRQWVCDSLVPYFQNGTRQRPCRSVCQTVEQRCPFFLPADRWPNIATQYAGEPTFLCIDANVPETEAQRNRSLYGDGDCCYKHCDTPEAGICDAKDCVDSSGAGSLPTPLHCAPLTISTPSPTDRSVASQCIATSGGPTPPARNSSSLNKAFVVWWMLVCTVVLQAVLVQRLCVLVIVVLSMAHEAVEAQRLRLRLRLSAVALNMAFVALAGTSVCSLALPGASVLVHRLVVVVVVACRSVMSSLRVARRRLRPVAFRVCARLQRETRLRLDVLVLWISRQGYFAFTSLYCPSASEFKVMRRSKTSLCLLKLLMKRVLLEIKLPTRTTTPVPVLRYFVTRQVTR